MSSSVAARLSAATDVDLREALRSHALELGLRGWVRQTEERLLCAHAEGERDALMELVAWLRLAADGAEVDERLVKAEGHEQFAIRGIAAGSFVVQEHQARSHHFDLRLEVGGVMRSWALPKGPSLDPLVKRLAVQVEDHDVSHNEFEGRTGSGAVIIWDRGEYEQGGRVSWPEALERGHAVFVLHGHKLRGGFALQRTGGGGRQPQWLLIKRRDEYARRGSDVVAELSESVKSGVTLEALLTSG